MEAITAPSASDTEPEESQPATHLPNESEDLFAGLEPDGEGQASAAAQYTGENPSSNEEEESEEAEESEESEEAEESDEDPEVIDESTKSQGSGDKDEEEQVSQQFPSRFPAAYLLPVNTSWPGSTSWRRSPSCPPPH